MTIALIVSKALSVLEGRHGFQYCGSMRQALDLQLDELVQPITPRSLVQISGTPGSGITHLLQNLASRHPKSVMWLPCDLFRSDITLIDHVCELVGLRSLLQRYQVVPSFLVEFLRLIGCTTLVIDDLDRFASTGYELMKIPTCLERLVTQAGLTIVYATHDRLLSNWIRKVDMPTKHKILFKDGLDATEIDQVAQGFWRWNNQRLQLTVDANFSRGRSLMTEHPTFANLLDCLEVAYVKALVSSFDTGLGAELDPFYDNPQRLRDELEAILYR
jgi:hypothetical protein